MVLNHQPPKAYNSKTISFFIPFFMLSLSHPPEEPCARHTHGNSLLLLAISLNELISNLKGDLFPSMPGHAASDMMGCPLFMSSHFTVQSSLNMPILVLSYKSKERTVRDIIQQVSKVSKNMDENKGCKNSVYTC